MSLTGKKRTLVAVVVAVVVVVAIASAIFARKTSAANEFFTEPLQRGPIRNVVNATGTVQAVLTVQVGSQVSGQIQALYADFNSVVKRGQLLAKIDPRNFEAQVEQAKANLAAAQARVTTTEADLTNQIASLQSAKANLESARVTRDNTAQIFERYKDLRASGVVSQNDFDNAKASAEGSAAKYQQAEAQTKQGEAQISSSKAQIEQAKAQVAQAKAGLNQAQVNLDYTSIFSPVDGVVVSRSVDVGQTVAASLQTPTLYLIANDLAKMQVNASVDEADIGSVSDAVDVQFTVDAYRNDNFRGRITEIRLNPQTVSNVVTYSVIIGVDNEQLKLKPGMTANIRMTVSQRDNALRMPNAALRYLPPGTTREQVAELMRNGGGANGGARTESKDGNQPAPAATDGGGASGGVSQVPGEGGEGRAAWQDGRRGQGGWNGGGRPVDVSGPAGTSGGRRNGGMQRAAGEKEGFAVGPEPGARPLAPGQLWNPAEKIQFPTSTRRAVHPGVVWTLGADKKPQPKRVMLGITDGVVTEVISGEVGEKDPIIVADSSVAGTGQQAGNRGGGGPRAGGFGFGGGR